MSHIPSRHTLSLIAKNCSCTVTKKLAETNKSLSSNYSHRPLLLPQIYFLLFLRIACIFSHPQRLGTSRKRGAYNHPCISRDTLVTPDFLNPWSVSNTRPGYTCAVPHQLCELFYFFLLYLFHIFNPFHDQTFGSRRQKGP